MSGHSKVILEDLLVHSLLQEYDKCENKSFERSAGCSINEKDMRL